MNEQMRIYAENQMAPTDGSCSLGTETEKYIQELNFFSFIKFSTDEYENFKVAVLPLLRVLLNASYNISTNNNFSFNLKPSKLNFKNRRKIVLPYFSVNYKKVSVEQYGKSVEKHLLRFIEFIEKNTNIEIDFIGNSGYKKRYISYNDWSFLAVIFIYYDGRYFSDRYENVYLPYFDKHRSCSIYSYKLALRELLEWLDVENLKEADNNDVIFIVTQLQSIDETFKFFKINKINTIRNEMLSNDFLKEIYNSLDLTYEEVISLADVLDKEIFKNDDFIEKCLNLNYLNPLFIFKYFFKYYMVYNELCMREDTTFLSDDLKKYNIKTTEKKISLKKLISKSKADTFEYIKIICDAGINCNKYSPEPKDSKFLKDYYFENHKSLIERLEEQFENGSAENEYLDYLIAKVFDTVPKYEKDAQ